MKLTIEGTPEEIKKLLELKTVEIPVQVPTYPGFTAPNWGQIQNPDPIVITCKVKS